ncbi:anti-sigma factor family protein [Ralstonia pickettii]|uniref:anti-sigma factor family protein n=1 Tax=Ralstonia pickettii TaxID=329 RepID=UPI0015BEBE4A|nr:anti-sigma factor [Ralstonia pickettii]NWK45777.1 anti-sigma factor [Ralstonia pickettii]
MSSNSIHIDELHAYADGRLPAARRAEVEAYLAAHPGAAAEVAAWRETDAQLHRALDPLLNEPVPQRRIPAAILGAARRPTATGFGAMRGWGVVALSVACLAIGSGAGWLSRGVVERTMPMQRFANDALVSHVVFAPESKHIVEVPADEEAHLVTWLSRRLDAQLHVPDLRSLGYRLIGGRQTVVADAPTAMLMYEGPGGTRISVQLRRMPSNRDTGFRLETLAPDNRVLQAIHPAVDHPPPMAFYWADHGLGFAVAGPLARAQLLEVAQVVFRQYSEFTGPAPRKE